jgi:hypothetical protein
MAPRTGVVVGLALAVTAVTWAQEPVHLSFDGDWLQGPPQALVSEQVTRVPGRTGDAAHLGLESRLACAAPAFLREGFDIRLWVRHDRPLREFHFDELVYLYHQTPDERNRICLQKRAGTDYLVFSMSDGAGRAKGNNFAGNWFAIKSPPLNWPAGTWHELRLTASRAAGTAALCVDGKPATARGSQLPQQIGERLWLGSWAGRSQIQGDLDDVIIAPAGGEVQ